MILGLLLARAGIEVTVLEKHADFLRDFRGDTVHASTLTLLDELGLAENFDKLPHRMLEQLQVQLDQGAVPIADLRRLPGPHKHIALVPQWDLLDLLADAANAEPTFRLRMNTEVTGLLRRGGRVTGVTYRSVDGDGIGELAADLVVAADGRSSTVRAAAGLRPREFGVPMDVWWFRLPRYDTDPAGGLGRFGSGRGVVLIDRGDYFQCAFLIRKGLDPVLRAEGIESFHQQLVDLVPWLAGRAATVTSWDDVKLLTVKLNRLRRWFGRGVLCIGDAAHAMSPVAGVGINLAVQDAVAAATILAGPLRRGAPSRWRLARVQARRWLPTAVTQLVQRVIHKVLLGRALSNDLSLTGTSGAPPLPIRLLHRFPRLQAVPAYFIAIGVRPEHAPEPARR